MAFFNNCNYNTIFNVLRTYSNIMIRKYYLHSRLRKDGIRYNSRNKTIYLGYESIIKKHCNFLVAEYNYIIQTIIE